MNTKPLRSLMITVAAVIAFSVAACSKPADKPTDATPPGGSASNAAGAAEAAQKAAATAATAAADANKAELPTSPAATPTAEPAKK